MKVMLEELMCKHCISWDATPCTWEVFQIFFIIMQIRKQILAGLQLISSPNQCAVPAVTLIVVVLLAVPEQCIVSEVLQNVS